MAELEARSLILTTGEVTSRRFFKNKKRNPMLALTLRLAGGQERHVTLRGSEALRLRNVAIGTTITARGVAVRLVHMRTKSAKIETNNRRESA